MASAVVELNHHQTISDSSLGSMPTRSRARITTDSIPLDNLSTDDDQKKNEATRKCNHFSIRGYVAEFRKRDPKFCDPFYQYRNNDSCNESRHELPPMMVPKFRWWNCEGCVPASSSETGMGKEAHGSAEDEAHPSKQLMVEVSNIKALRERNTEVASTSSDSNNRNCSQSAICAVDRKGKGKAHVEDEAIVLQTGCNENGIVKLHQHYNVLVGIGQEAAKDYMNHEDGKACLAYLPDLNECNRAPSDDGDQNEVLVSVNNNLFDEEDDYLGVDRRKTPKVRLLSELLGLKESHNDAKLNKRNNPSFSEFRCSDAQRSGVYYPQAVNNGTKKLKPVDSETSESESEDESTETISEALVKKRSKSTPDKRPLPEKRSSKKLKIDHEGSSLMSQVKIAPKSSSGKDTNNVPTDGSMLKPYKEAHPDQVIDLARKSDGSGDFNERRSFLSKRKRKADQGRKEQTYVGERASSSKEKEILQKGVEHVRNELNQNGSHIHLLPDSFVKTGNDHIQVASGKHGFSLLPSSKEPIIIDYGVRKQTANNCVGETSFGFRTSGVGPVTESQFDGVKERSIGTTMNSKAKQSQFPEGEKATPLAQDNAIQLGSSVSNQKEPSRRVQDIDINSIPTEDKVPEQRTGDDSHDIPMDIVELMAKNQYERNLSEPKDRHRSGPLSGNAIFNGSTSTCGEPMPNWSQPHSLSWHNPLPKDARNGVMSGFEPTDSSKQLRGPFSDFNQTHLNFKGHRSENQTSSTTSLTFSQGQEPYSAFGLPLHTRHMGAQQRCPPGFLQTMGTYNSCHSSSSGSPSIESRAWPSVVAGHKGNSHHQGPSILSFGMVNLEKQNINFSNAYNGGKQKGTIYPLKPMGSVDLHQNEVIPAMHLLSLMQNAAATVQSAVGSSTDSGKPELHKRSNVSSLPDHHLPFKQHHSNQKSRHSLIENNGRTSTIHDGSCHPCYPTLPPVRSFASSFQSNGGIGTKPSFLTPIPLTSRGQRNIESSHFASLRADKPVSCNEGRKRQLDTALDKGKGISGMSNPSSSTNPFQGPKNSASSPFGLSSTHDKKTVWPTPQKEICKLNLNPSEFNDLRELRKYMIKPEDLRPRETRHEKSIHRGTAKRPEMRMNVSLV